MDTSMLRRPVLFVLTLSVALGACSSGNGSRDGGAGLGDGGGISSGGGGGIGSAGSAGTGAGGIGGKGSGDAGGASDGFTAFPLPMVDPNGITSGPGGNLWFTEYSGKKIGRITLTGILIEFPVPTASGGAAITTITSGPD